MSWNLLYSVRLFVFIVFIVRKGFLKLSAE